MPESRPTRPNYPQRWAVSGKDRPSPRPELRSNSIGRPCTVCATGSRLLRTPTLAEPSVIRRRFVLKLTRPALARAGRV
jgi:hypothetical protein